MARPTSILVLIVAAAFMSMMAPAQALYIETPLKLLGESDRAEVGQDVAFQIEPDPQNASAKQDWAGKTVKVRYTYDKNERQAGDPDSAVSNEGYTEGNLTELVLDHEARGSFRWTIPAELDGFNIAIFLEDDDGDRLAFAYIGVGDAPEQMRITGGQSGNMEPDLEGETGRDTDASEEDGAGEQADAPAPGFLLAALTAVGAVAVAVALRRHEQH